jgi:hypothetical protein
MEKSAVLSPCGTYRYSLTRTWDISLPSVSFIGLNPSTADADRDDATSRVYIRYAERWGFGTLYICNLFALRSRDPRELRIAKCPIGCDNDSQLNQLQNRAQLTVCARGNPGGFLGRDEQVLATLVNPDCLVKLKSGRPGHPLFKSLKLKPIPLT